MENLSKENLSKRLLAAAELTENPGIIADIGTDHAYLPIFLLKNGKTPFALCCDINKGPLERAEKNLRDRNLFEKAALRLGNGLSPLKKGEADTIFICGMGGLTIASVLEAEPDIALSAKTLILQPQSDIPALRKYITEKGFFIWREKMVFESGFYYTILGLKPGDSPVLSDAELLLGPCLLAEHPPVFMEYIGYRKERLSDLIDILERKNSPAAREKARLLHQELDILKEVR